MGKLLLWVDLTPLDPRARRRRNASSWIARRRHRLRTRASDAFWWLCAPMLAPARATALGGGRAFTEPQPPRPRQRRRVPSPPSRRRSPPAAKPAEISRGSVRMPIPRAELLVDLLE